MAQWGILREEVATPGSNFQKIENLGLATFKVKFRPLVMVSDHTLWPLTNCSLHIDINAIQKFENPIAADE